MLRRLSLTSRLTVSFTLVIAAMAFGLGWVCLQAVERHFEELDRTTLQDKRYLIEDILSHANSSEDARQRLGEALSHHHGLYAQVKSAQGETLFASEGFASTLSSEKHGPSSNAHRLETWVSGDTELHGIKYSVAAELLSASPLDIAIAVDTEHHRKFLIELHRSLSIYAVLAIVLSGLLGWLAAHQGMSPLRAMKKRAASVSGHQLQPRMPVEAVPIEMADLAQALNDMLDRLEQDFQRLSEFSSDLAHELRTPISNLLTQTQVILSSQRDVASYRDVLASNAEELQRLARMVSDMLFLAKAEHGLMLPSKERIALDDEVRALFDFYDALADEKGIALQLSGQASVLGDRLMLRRAISNLLSNALRHASTHSTVSVTLGLGDNAVRLNVRNQGAAIAPDILPRLFDRFFRADKARAHQESDGVGLGLSITQAIVHAHGGKIQASSVNGVTTFSMELPKD